jgi:hypothetical protein
VRIQLLYIEASPALVHINAVANRAFDLNGLRAVAFLSVQLTTVPHIRDRVNEHHGSLIFGVCRVVWRRHDGLACRVESKVGLVHQLLIERGVYGLVVVGGDVDTHNFVAVFEKFVQDGLLLVTLDTHTFALDGTARKKISKFKI